MFVLFKLFSMSIWPSRFLVCFRRTFCFLALCRLLSFRGFFWLHGLVNGMIVSVLCRFNFRMGSTFFFVVRGFVFERVVWKGVRILFPFSGVRSV